MKILIDASLPRAVSQVITDCGHDPIDVRDVGLTAASDAEIAAYAKLHGHAILTADFDFADIRHYRPQEFYGIIVIDRPKNATVEAVLALVRELFRRSDVIAQLQSRVVIIDPQRIRIRPPLAGG